MFGKLCAAGFVLMRGSLAISCRTASAEYRVAPLRVRSLECPCEGAEGNPVLSGSWRCSSEWAVVEIADVRMGGPPGGERRSVVVERAFADRNGLKASVAAALVILVGERAAFLRA
jgi:hypothetical protein